MPSLPTASLIRCSGITALYTNVIGAAKRGEALRISRTVYEPYFGIGDAYTPSQSAALSGTVSLR